MARRQASPATRRQRPSPRPKPGYDPSGWRRRPAAQQPDYPDENDLIRITDKISDLPALVSESEVLALQAQLESASTGKAVILQAGDCAERFQDCTPRAIALQLDLLEDLADELQMLTGKPVVTMGRMAGQYAKPRSQPTEHRVGHDGHRIDLPVFRGDAVNAFEPIHELRLPDPQRLLLAYHFSALTMSYAREILRHRAVLTPFYFCHEALLLAYEEAMTRRTGVARGKGGYYNAGAHFLWVGERTRQLGGAHAEYLSGILNPVGIKVGPTADPREIATLATRLNPHGIPGRVTIMTRLGVSQVGQVLPSLISALHDSPARPIWVVDPMHGNTVLTSTGIKTRHTEQLAREVRETLVIHQRMGTHLAGVHLEVTGKSVIECTGGPAGIRDSDLGHSYDTSCDPRLNRDQALVLVRALEVISRPHLRRCLVGSGPHLPGVNSGPRLPRV